MKRHIACFALVVDDYDRAIAYYTGVLGFELREDSPREAAPGQPPKRWVVVAPAGAETGNRTQGSGGGDGAGRLYIGASFDE